MHHLMGLKKFILIIFLVSTVLLLMPSSIQAIDIYADLEITVDNTGFVTIEGDTNHPNILVKDSQNYTTKTQSIWTLNISINMTFSDFVYSITIPEHAEILSLSSTGLTLISQQSGNLLIRGYGTNESLSITLQYQMDKISENNRFFGLDLFTQVLIVFNIVLIICFFIVLYYVNKNKKPQSTSRNEKTSYNELRGLNDRQKKIITLLKERNIAITQTDIQRELNIPNASVSRNIRSLELKGLIEKERIGMSNFIRLKKP